jgi:hypothetical protein
MTDAPSTIAEQRKDLLRQVVFNRATDIPSSQPELFRAEVGLVVHGFMADFYAAALAEAAPERAEQVAAELAEYLDDGALPEYAWDRAVELGHNPQQWIDEYEAAHRKRAEKAAVATGSVAEGTYRPALCGCGNPTHSSLVECPPSPDA